MKKFYFGFLSIALLIIFNGCSDWVQSVDGPIDTVPGEELTNAENLDFLTLGLKGSFAETHDVLTVTAAALSDEQVFDRDLPQATFPSYDRLDRGAFLSTDGTINNELGQLRFYADDLIRRVNEVGEVGEEFQEDKQEALFYSYFLGGVARAWYASYLGLEPEQGGGAIDNGPFIPSAEMYDLALAKMDSSLAYATPYQERIVNSTMARIHLYAGEYEAALQAAQNGLEPGDSPFQSIHSVESTNEWYFAAGEGRVQFRVQERFREYVNQNPQEKARLPMFEIEGRSGTTYYVQNKYPERGTSITFIDWQETHLILAEAALRTGNESVDPLALVNEVRDSHGLSALSSVDMDVIITERDKELFARGQRLIDQRRFNSWHLAADSWKYFPISEEERNNNPHF